MHEMMVAEGLLTAISTEAEKHNATPLAAKVSCGKLYVINDEALAFAFEAIARGTICENVKLEIEHKPIEAKCKSCGTIFDIETNNGKCPECRGEAFELEPDPPLLLEEIEFEAGEQDDQSECSQADS
jgi:hydrogenase nickel incorporation protein HypA/HybF